MVDPTDRIGATSPIDDEHKGSSATPAPGSFESYMKQPAAGGVGQPSQISPFELSQGGAQPTITPNMGMLQNQVVAAQSTLGDMQTQLSTPGLKLSRSQQYLLKNKFSDASARLQSVGQKLGAEPVPGPKSTPGMNPVEKFLGYLTNGQAQIQAAKQKIQDLNDRGQNLSPGQLLQIQTDMAQAQKLLEYSSVLLSNAVNAFKSLMNIQL